MLDNWSLDYKDKTIFNSKRNEEKVIDGWDVKIEEKLRKKNWEDPFSTETYGYSYTSYK
jgi:hypothetical protein